ncbi:MAG: polysaccharide biosynthesis/export family protein [Prochlorococcaceae cyanobacterium]|jgi:polysaccharide export outer membrane protein
MSKFLVWLIGVLCFLGVAGESLALPISPGDRVKITIPEGEEFSGIFEINLNGELELPYSKGIYAVGLEPQQLQQRVYQSLVEQGFFQPAFLRVSLSVVQWAPVPVFVTGSTFQPGRVLINELSDVEQTQAPVPLSGQAPLNRMLTTALRRAGGITPTADVTAVQLKRGSRKQVIDLTGAFTGEPFDDIPLIAGDQVIVPDTGVLNPLIVRPSVVTPSEININISNLTVPAAGNSVAAIGNEAQKFPYGARFSHAVVSANCAGGTMVTNARRRALLVRTETATGKTTVFERGVEQVLRDSTDNRNNPYLMADDGVTCYDSGMTNFQAVLGIVTQFLTPSVLIYDRIVP